MTSSLHSLLPIITDTGDAASLIAITAAGSLYLVSRRSGRAATFLIAALLVSAFAIALLKLIFLSCAGYFHFSGIHSPSGHASDSAAVFWTLAMLMRSQLDAQRRFLPLAFLTLLVLAIAVSRIMLGYHTAAEAAIGLVTGFMSIFIARFLIMRGHTVAPFDAYALALWCVVAAFLAHGIHLPAEEWLQGLSIGMKNHLRFCTGTP